MNTKPPRRDCLFCGVDLVAGRAREHIFPQWLLRHFDVAADSIQPTYMIIDEMKLVDRTARRHLLRDSAPRWPLAGASVLTTP
jgi:hypothetical protein